MLFGTCHALVVVFLSQWLWVQPSLAHSTAARPLKRLEHPSTISLEILPRLASTSTLSPRSSTLRYDDTFRLILTAFDTDFYLHLRPNDHLVHPAAKIQYLTFDETTGEHVVESTKPLLRDQVKVYFGEVIEAEHSDRRMREDTAHLFRPAGVRYPEQMGWARITVHDQGDTAAALAPTFEGAFSVYGVVYHVMTTESYLRSKHELDVELVNVDSTDGHLVVWRETDVMSADDEHYVRTGSRLPSSSLAPQSCAHDALPWNHDADLNPALRQHEQAAAWLRGSFGQFANVSLFRRDDVPGGGAGGNFRDSIGSNAGCPSEQRVVYMGVAADCRYVQDKGGKDQATQAILADWNSATALYRDTFNVSLGIIELQIQDASCPSTTDNNVPWNIDCGTVTLDERLSLFSQWRGAKGTDGAGLWHLMSGCPTGTEVGIAWLATLCQTDTNDSGGQTVSGTAVSTGGRTEWQVVAHETGHNFGAIHDCTDTGCTSSPSCCPISASSCDSGGQFIMSPVSSDGQGQFSPCTLGNICSTLGNRGDSDSCLINPADTSATRPMISLQMCGNGIVEDGEDCDPGSSANSTCCDPATCKFRENAACDPLSSPCCTDQCSFAPSTQTCRASKDDRCDTAEMCTGSSSTCPTDTIAPNGQRCGDNGLQCASGQCTSVSEQCRTVGSSMGLKEGCRQQDNSCRISCQDPNSANQCIILSSSLIDGSPCGYGGTCENGSCASGSTTDTIKSWYERNLQIAIPVTIVAGLLILGILWCLIRSIANCGRTRRATTIIHPAPASLANMRHQRLDSRGPYPSYPPPNGPPPPLMGQNRPPSTGNRLSRTRTDHQWVDPTAYNGNGFDSSRLVR